MTIKKRDPVPETKRRGRPKRVPKVAPISMAAFFLLDAAANLAMEGHPRLAARKQREAVKQLEVLLDVALVRLERYRALDTRKGSRDAMDKEES